MAVPSYTTDLTDIIDFESTATLNTEVVGYTATAKPTNSTDFPIQGTGHADAEQRSTGTGSLIADNGTGVTWTSGDYVFIWGTFLAPAAVNTFANEGIALFIGSSNAAFYRWAVGGNDFGRYPYGGWQNFVVDPELATGRTTVGAPGTTYRWFGILCNVINAISKGSPYGLDVIRYGRGEIIITDGQAADYATFDGLATENDYNDATNGYHRWGLFTLQGGSYIWKGLMSLGTTTLVDMRDSNRNIVIENSINVNSDFNRIEVNNASSNLEWSRVNITALGTISKGEFEMIDNANVDFTDCVFTDMSTFIFQSNATLVRDVFNRCALITQDGATFTDCVFDSSTNSPAILVDNMSLVSGCSFVSVGTGHALEITTAGTYNLADCVFTGYGLDETTDAAIYNNSGGLVTLNRSGGLSTTVLNGSGASTVIQASVTIDVHVQDEAAADIGTAYVYIDTAPSIGDTADIANTTTDASGDITQASYSGAASSAVIRVRKYGYKANKGTISLLSNTINTVILIADPQQS